MTLPGPSGAVWALELLVWAAGAAAVGELLRGVAVRWVAIWRDLGAIERLLLDFYLGGAVVYLIAAVPVGAFRAPVLVAVPVLAAILLGVREIARARRPSEGTGRSGWRVAPPVALALAVALALFLYEVTIASPVGTGNTYDSSLFTTYVAILLSHGSLPLSFAPYATTGILYPQASTAWFGWAQAVLAPPAARTSLLVTPLFLALAPLGGFVFARRAFRSDVAAVGLAVFFAVLGSWTRVLVGGSNDFVLAFPLVLVLAGELVAWTAPATIRIPDALAFGLLLGYSAAMNPVGAEWLLPAALILGLLAAGRRARDGARWVGRWAIVVLAALVALAPTLYELALGWSSPGLTPGAAGPPAGTLVGIGPAAFVGGIDPYLFGPSDVWLSPVPVLRDEIAILLTVGLAILILAGFAPAVRSYVERFRRFVIVGIVLLVGEMGLLWAARSGWSPAVRFAEISSAPELSIWLFTLYGMIAAVPLLLLLEQARRPVALAVPEPNPRPSIRSTSGATPAPGSSRAAVACALALIIVVPGAVLTGTSLPPVLSGLYEDFGNVTADDFALLEYAGSHLPSGSRVLVAPGSAALFLPGYASDLVLVYPMVPGWMWINASYQLLVRELSNATLDAAGLGAMAALDIGYIAVTGWNTVLWPPFSPTPLLAQPAAFPLEFHEGDAYLFERAGA